MRRAEGRQERQRHTDTLLTQKPGCCYDKSGGSERTGRMHHFRYFSDIVFRGRVKSVFYRSQHVVPSFEQAYRRSATSPDVLASATNRVCIVKPSPAAARKYSTGLLPALFSSPSRCLPCLAH